MPSLPREVHEVRGQAHSLAERGNFEDAIPLATAVAVHEAAHWFAYPGLHTRPANNSNLPAVRALGQLALAMPLKPLNEGQNGRGSGRDGGHDAAFLRRALHLANRMERIGWYCPISAVWPSSPRPFTKRR